MFKVLLLRKKIFSVPFPPLDSVHQKPLCLIFFIKIFFFTYNHSICVLKPLSFPMCFYISIFIFAFLTNIEFARKKNTPNVPLNHCEWHVQQLFCPAQSLRPPSGQSSHLHLQRSNQNASFCILKVPTVQSAVILQNPPFLMSLGRIPLTAVL